MSARALVSRTALALCLAAAGSPARADFDAGLAAFGRGQFAAAHASWLPCARDGDPRCQHGLAVLLDEGALGRPDPVAAVDWLRRAAAQDFPDAQMRLGFLLATGRPGVPQDPVEAWVWFARAAAQGVPQAAASRDRVGEFLTREERIEAQRRADEASIRYHLQK